MANPERLTNKTVAHPLQPTLRGASMVRKGVVLPVP
jgi:hypothetical protein